MYDPWVTAVMRGSGSLKVEKGTWLYPSGVPERDESGCRRASQTP